MTTDYELDGHDSIPGRGKRFISTLQCPDQLWNSPSRLAMDTEGSFPGDEVAGGKADNSPQSTAEVKIL
jgi:hypothetical protein